MDGRLFKYMLLQRKPHNKATGDAEDREKNQTLATILNEIGVSVLTTIVR